ncbi:helix-turn-helix domain-containing protein [Lactiplantibacillus plantarum]|uniref:helix-turn-helix domain-containing protein n=1 Tax=Lactiplantibacillus plantarum TaxID=1590 RepID=UPI0013E89A6F|nr:helix-turn-helix transcriptional regulator [Lactiplantibacillus plantarum]
MNNIRIARKAKNMSIVSLAKQSGLSVSSISAYENNKRQPKIESLQKISKVLGVSSAYLNGMSGEKNILNVNSQNPKNNTIDIDVIGFLLNARSTHPGKVLFLFRMH